MPTDSSFTFASPTPIRVDFELHSARLEFVAGERTDTLVTVEPRNPSRSGDVNAVRGTTVDFVDGHLSIVQPKRWNILGPNADTIFVTIELPVGSAVIGTIAMGNVRGTGRVGVCTIKSSYGDLIFDETAAAELRTSSGDIAIGAIRGDTELQTSNGAIRVDLIDGSGSAKTSNGDIVIGEVTGSLETKVGSGGIRIDVAGPETFAKIAYGNARIGQVAQGSVRLEGAYGELEVGVPEGTSAWLDLNSAHGFVRNELKADTAPQAGDRTVEVRARVNWGDIVVRRPVTHRPGDRGTRSNREGN